jgi:hypothetical protein
MTINPNPNYQSTPTLLSPPSVNPFVALFGTHSIFTDLFGPFGRRSRKDVSRLAWSIKAAFEKQLSIHPCSFRSFYNDRLKSYCSYSHAINLYRRAVATKSGAK